MSKQPTRIGELNGKWAFLLKLSLSVFLPAGMLVLSSVLALQVWLVKAVHRHDIEIAVIASDVAKNTQLATRVEKSEYAVELLRDRHNADMAANREWVRAEIDRRVP